MSMLPSLDDSFAAPIRLDQAIDRLRQILVPVPGIDIVPLALARGRVLVADQVSTLAVPPFDCSAMDGWAVRAADLGGEPLPVDGRVAAGHPLTFPTRPGHAYRIFTGAPLPAGLDTVIPQESAHEENGAVRLAPSPPGANIRRAGESVAAGDRPLTAGTVLGPHHLGVAATLGLATVPVRRRLRVALASTGDEVRDPGMPLPPGGLYDANRVTLRALLEGWGCTVSDLGIVADRPDSLAATLSRAAPDHDLIVTSGGVSVGEEDHLRMTVRALGRIEFWRLAIKPGKPLLVGRIGATPLLGLPGNPVAVMVGALLIGRVMIAALTGTRPSSPRRYRLPAAFSLRKPGGRRDFPRARLTTAGTLELFHTDSSGVLTSVTGADGLVDLPEDIVEIRPGDSIAFLPFSEIMP